MSSKLNQGLRTFFRWSGSTPTGTSLSALAATLLADAVTNLAPATSTNVTYSGAILEDLTSDMGAVGEAAGTHPGSRSGTLLPADTCFVGSYEITRRYRGGHPRSYFPFGVEADLENDQQWTPTAVTEFTTAVNDWIAGFVGQSSGGVTIGAHTTVGYYHGFTVVTNPTTGRARNVPTLKTPPTLTDVVSVIGRDYIGSQRRRRFKTS